jgi:murein DD-endopeptidase MepM/ murein hydrolase activator NlpD
MTPPEQWPLSGGYVTRGSGGESRYQGPHPGVDVAVPVGTEIRAAGGGLVVEAGENPEYGKFVRVQHSDQYETLYGHTSSLLVRTGDRVTSGQPIAYSGNTGRSTGPHLHFEVRRAGKAVDPLQIIKKGL